MPNIGGKYLGIPGLVAGADLSAAQYKCVKLASTAGEVIASAAATDTTIGILQNDPADGEPADVAHSGSCLAVAEASVSRADLLASNSTGQVQATTSANNKLIGVAIEASTNAGELILIALSQGNY